MGRSPWIFHSAILSSMDAVTLTRQLVDIESITGNEAGVGNYLYGELCRLGYQTKRCRLRASASMCMRPRQSSHIPKSYFPRTWIRFRPSSLRRKTRGEFTDADRATPKASSPRRSRLRNVCANGRPCGPSVRGGEERDSLGAQVANEYAANEQASRCRFLINGEPTENRLARGIEGHVEGGGDCNRTHGALGLSGIG